MRFIQEMLGHANLEIHAATHPSPKRGRFEQAAAVENEEDLDAESSETNELGRKP